MTFVTLPPAGHAAFPGANGKIAFDSNRDGNEEIYVINVDGTSETRLTNNSASDHRAAWSPDGNKIAFNSNLGGNFDVWVMNADGTVQTMVTNNLAEDARPHWGPVPAPPVIEVVIDIKPGSFPNSINLSSAGVVPVAILSSATFDATQVDAATVTLAGAAVKLIGKANKFSCSIQYVNEDGLPDLLCHVLTDQLQIAPGDSAAVLKAKTLSGQDIQGEDSINIVP